MKRCAIDHDHDELLLPFSESDKLYQNDLLIIDEDEEGDQYLLYNLLLMKMFDNHFDRYFLL